jgi:protein-S-isoprenylcysteine O-methyltransferase Ste14
MIPPSALKMGLATIGFALLHSALASRKTKQAAQRLLGSAASGHNYRLFYTAQAAISLLALARYGARLPSKTLYTFSGPAAWLFRCGQCAGLWHLYRAASEVGIARLAGFGRLQAWLAHKPALPAPLAQGPEIDASGQLTVCGPYAWSRHPLNFSGIPVFWLTPRMTDTRLAFNLVSTAYFILGSWHEAARLRAGYGHAYRQYEQCGAPFYWPRVPTRLLAPHDALFRL